MPMRATFIGFGIGEFQIIWFGADNMHLQGRRIRGKLALQLYYFFQRFGNE